MKNVISSPLLRLLLLTLVALPACASQEMQLHGTMSTFEFRGETCWVFRDDQGRPFEVITPSSQILRDGLQLSIRAVKVKAKTLCELPNVIEVLEYRPDFAKDMK